MRSEAAKASEDREQCRGSVYIGPLVEAMNVPSHLQRKIVFLPQRSFSL